ncbi:hypothetical protein FO519_002140 [Halicephalobus sp. NKZ332]|nr:hypothetical protein FO519_002140 [Halicephalobus sp. NKZ332]
MSEEDEVSWPGSSRKYSRVISAPARRRSNSRNDPIQKKLERALYRLPGDATKSNESIHEEPKPSPPEIVLDPASLTNEEENWRRRRASNLKMQSIIRRRLLEPMIDVDRRPDERRNSISTPTPMTNTSSPKFFGNGETLPIQNLPISGPNLLNSSSTSKGARFAHIARSITLLSKKPRVENSASSQEHENFFNKYGMSSTSVANNPSQAESPQVKNLKYYWKNFVVDSSEDNFYYWLWIVTSAYVYNLLLVPFRCVFLDSTVDFKWKIMFFVLDGYLEQGLLVRDVNVIVKAYRKTTTFWVDILCLLPLDYVLEIGIDTPKPVLRFNRLAKLDRVRSFISATETRISFPNAFRVFCVIAYIVVLIHWNGCIYFLVSSAMGLGSDNWVYGSKNTQSLPPFYWSTLILTTIGEVPGPVHNAEFAFVTMDLMCGVLIFATIVGNVGSMISNMSAARTDFQAKVDRIKQYMDLRKVSKHLEIRVIKWFDYLWANKQTLADQQVLQVLPDKLQAEIAMHVHFETLRKVRIFQDCEAGLLAELVLKLQLQVFSPGDYVCRKGDIGREMYIVKRGKLEVLTDDGQTTLATLQEGAVFGELSILNIAGSRQGNRRSANIRSVGYADLFTLSKDHLWEALREYPDARRMLIQKGRELLKKDNLLDENAPEENKTAEELAIELQAQLAFLQTKMAKLLAEQTSQNDKLLRRVDWLENKLAKYENINIHRDEEGRLRFYGET